MSLASKVSDLQNKEDKLSTLTNLTPVLVADKSLPAVKEFLELGITARILSSLIPSGE